MSQRIKAKLDKNIVKFQFLCNIPTPKVTPPLDKEQCAICKEGYQNNSWQREGTVHRPAVLPCSHLLGFQCLIRWMLSPNFDNFCPFCRTQIVDPRKSLSPALVSSFARLEILLVVAGKGISRAQRSQLLDVFEKPRWAMTNTSDRVMVVWKEFLNSMCNESETPLEENPARLNGPIAAMRQVRLHLDRVLAYRELLQDWLLSLRIIDARIRLLSYAVGVAVGTMDLLLDLVPGHDSIWSATNSHLDAMSLRLLLRVWFLGLVVCVCRVPWGHEIAFAAMVSGLLLGLCIHAVVLLGFYYFAG